MDKDINIYNYTDFRCFLKERFLSKKSSNPSFSYRVFCRKAGIKSSGFLKLVIDGKKNLGTEGIRKFIRGFDLGERESRYFALLVHFNQAKSHEDKEYYFKKITKNSGFQRAKILAAAQYNIFTHWYYVAILELARLDVSQIKNYQWLKDHLKPAVKLKPIKKAVSDLKELGLLREEKNGNLVRQEAMLATTDEVEAFAVSEFHIQMSQLAIRSVQTDLSQDREFSALTIAMSEQGYQKAKKEIQEFRKKIHDILEKETSQPKSFVGHANFQLFKLSQ